MTGTTFAFRPLTEEDARIMIDWRYEGRAAFYDLAPEDFAEILEELTSYRAATDEAGELAGFFVFGAGAQVPGGRDAGLYPPDALDVGLGLRPDLVGQGLGTRFVVTGLADARGCLVPPPRRFRLSVAVWNERAIRAYARAGFVPGPRCPSMVRGTETTFLLMTMPEPEETDEA